MALWLNFIYVLIGVAFIVLTANFAIRSSLKIAKLLKLSDEFIGMTILAIGTSLPEIMTSVVSAFKINKNPALMNDLSGLVVGTNVGSDIFQQNFILGLIAVVAVVTVGKKHILKDVGGLIAATIITFVFAFNGVITRIEGGVMLAIYAAYLIFLERKGVQDDISHVHHNGHNGLWKNMGILILSFIVMAFAANKVVDNSEIIIESVKISASLFGVVVLGVAAALPELITALTAVWKKKNAVTAGVLIGSNVTNPMFAMALGATISSFKVPAVTVEFDLPVKIITAVFILLMLWNRKKLKKPTGVILLLIYIAYITLRHLYYPVDF